MRNAMPSAGARIVVFGTGECARRVLAAKREGVHAVAASDNNARMWGRWVSGVSVVEPAAIRTLTYDYIVVCSAWAAAIVPSLVDAGIERTRILSCYEVDHDAAGRRQELSVLNELFDVAAAGISLAPGPMGAARVRRHSGIGRLVSVYRRLLTACRDARSWYRLFCRFPIDRRIALFDSYWGAGYSCNPRAISEYLASAPDGRQWKVVWGLTDPSMVETPAPVAKVKRLGIAYHYYAARAGLLVTNVNFPDHIVKRPGSIHLQTMHGTPIKTLGLDVPGELASTQAQTAFRERCRRWDYVTAPGQYTADIARRAFRFDGTILPIGYPRNDYLFSGNTRKEIARVRRTLGIPESRKVLLFAPTWRPTGDDAVAETTRALLASFRNDPVLSEQYALLLRFHHLMHERPWSTVECGSEHVIDVSSHPDNRELMLVADALVTDYSSIVFDYALLERPIVLCCLDYRRYREETRGVYTDIVREAPWPVYQTADEILDALPRGVAALSDRAAHRRFVARFAEWDRGDACKRLYEDVLLPWAASPRFHTVGPAPRTASLVGHRGEGAP